MDLGSWFWFLLSMFKLLNFIPVTGDRVRDTLHQLQHTTCQQLLPDETGSRLQSSDKMLT